MSYLQHGAACLETVRRCRWSRATGIVGRSFPSGSRPSAFGPPSWRRGSSSDSCWPWRYHSCGVPHLLVIMNRYRGGDIRVVVIHGGRSLEIVRSNTIWHPHHGLVIAAHGASHHHALGSLVALHLGEVLVLLAPGGRPFLNRTYASVVNVLKGYVFGVVLAGGAPDVPELHPPVQEERVVCGMAGRDLGSRYSFIFQVLVHGVDAIDVASARTRLLWRIEAHRYVALDHHSRELLLAVPQKVVVNVRVELVARVHLAVLLGPALAVCHDGRAVDGALCRVHAGHASHLGVLHRSGD